MLCSRVFPSTTASCCCCVCCDRSCSIFRGVSCALHGLRADSTEFTAGLILHGVLKKRHSKLTVYTSKYITGSSWTLLTLVKVKLSLRRQAHFRSSDETHTAGGWLSSSTNGWKVGTGGGTATLRPDLDFRGNWNETWQFLPFTLQITSSSLWSF